MKKLSLNLDSLRVQSFATQNHGGWPWGTVHGRNDPDEATVTRNPREDCEWCGVTGEMLCATGHGLCTRPPNCPAESGIDTCPRQPGQTQGADCKETAECDPPVKPCPGPFSLVSCIEAPAG